MLSLGVQPKLTVGEPHDAFEMEADRMADHVLGGAPPSSASTAGIQRKAADEPKKDDAKKPAAEPKKDDKKVQKKADEPKKDDAKKPVAEPKKDEKKVQKKAEEPKKDDAKKASSEPKKDDKKVQKKADEPKKEEAKKPPAEPKKDEKKVQKKADEPKKEDAKSSKPEGPKDPKEKKKLQEELPNATIQKKADDPKKETKSPSKDEKKRPEAQRAAEPSLSEEEKHPEDMVQAKADAGQAPDVDPGLEGRLRASRGGGSPIPEAQRGFFESRFGQDLSSVRLHTDDAAAQAARSMRAQAFTIGQDVYFASGKYQPSTQQGQRLLAHELTHTIQQGGPGGPQPAAQRIAAKGAEGLGRPSTALPGEGRVQRANDDKPKEGEATLTGSALDIKKPLLQVPKFKKQEEGGFYGDKIERPAGATRKSPRSKWVTATAGAETAMKGKMKDEFAIEQPGSTKKLYAFRTAKDKGTYLFGEEENLTKIAAFPNWDAEGRPTTFDIDHRHEMQLGGPNEKENLELVDSAANRSSGSRIDKNIRSAVAAALPAAEAPIQDVQKAMDTYTITFAIDPTGFQAAGDGKRRWPAPDIDTGKHLASELVEPMTLQDAEKEGLFGGDKLYKVYFSPGGGASKDLEVEEGGKVKAGQTFVKGFELQSGTLNQNQGGKLKGLVLRRNKVTNEDEKREAEWSITNMRGMAGFINKHHVRMSLTAVEIKPMSLIEWDEVDVDPGRGLYALGHLTPSIPLLSKVPLDIVLEGNDLRLEKTFSGDELQLGGPFKITASSLTVGIGTGGFSASGDVEFEITKVGKGKISAKKADEFEAKGEFDVDPKLAENAKIEAWYRNKEFGGRGTIRIGPNKVKGVKSATITATFQKDLFEAKGDVELSVPGIKSAELAVRHSAEEGLVVSGGFQLKNDIPGIKGGSGQATVKQKPEGGWSVEASGKAQPNVPGLNSEVDFSYRDGAFTGSVTAGFTKGRLSGDLTVGVTNQPVADGQPAGEPGNDLHIFGSGSLTLKVAPWLQGTAQVTVKPDGQLKVMGEISLPSALDVFEQKKWEKNLLSIGLDIPIVGVAVAGQRIGIFANISGGIDLDASIGPGQLRDTRIRVEYDPAHEEQTKVSGGAQFHIPAQAGIRLFVRGGLGAGIPIVSATAGIEVGGRLGIEGALTASVNVEWTPAKGVVLDAEGEVKAEPKFRFDVAGFVNVEADLLLTTVELYSKRWQLASFEYGSGLQLGLKMPIHYEEGKPFDINFDQIEFTKPDINPKQVLEGLIKQIA